MYDSPRHSAEHGFDHIEELGTGGQWGGLYNRISFGQSFIIPPFNVLEEILGNVPRRCVPRQIDDLTITNSPFAGCTTQSCRGKLPCAMVQRPVWRIPPARIMYRRLGRTAEARSSYEKALALTQQEPERQFLQERIWQLK
jgi:hypothetical protein